MAANEAAIFADTDSAARLGAKFAGMDTRELMRLVIEICSLAGSRLSRVSARFRRAAPYGGTNRQGHAGAVYRHPGFVRGDPRLS